MIRTVPKTVEEEVAACNLCGVIWKLGLEQTLKEACQGWMILAPLMGDHWLNAEILLCPLCAPSSVVVVRKLSCLTNSEGKNS